MTTNRDDISIGSVIIIILIAYNCLLCFLHLITQYTDRPAAINRANTMIIPPTVLPTVLAP